MSRARKRKPAAKKKTNPKRKHPRRVRRRAHALKMNPRRRHKRRHNPGGAILSIALAAVLGGVVGAVADVGFDRFGGSLPSQVRPIAKVAGAGAAVFFGQKHPAIAAAVAGGLVASEITWVVKKGIDVVAPSTAKQLQAIYQAQQLQAIYADRMGAVYQG